MSLQATKASAKSNPRLRVGVGGALGRMGRVACTAIASAPGMELVAGFARNIAGREPAERVPLYDDLERFFAQKMDVVVDFTVHPVTVEVALRALKAGISPVIGATGWTEADVRSLQDAVRTTNLGAMLVPNFAIGAVMLIRLAEIAAPHFRGVEIIEMHHDQKKDKPSGTARLTADRIEAAAPHLGPVPIHSLRLPGLVAHHSVLFGATGQTLELRHDSMARESFADGIVLAVREVGRRRGLTIGLDAVLFGEGVPAHANRTG